MGIIWCVSQFQNRNPTSSHTPADFRVYVCHTHTCDYSDREEEGEAGRENSPFSASWRHLPYSLASTTEPPTTPLAVCGFFSAHTPTNALGSLLRARQFITSALISVETVS